MPADLSSAIREAEGTLARYLAVIEEDPAFDRLDYVTIAACLKLRQTTESLLAAARGAKERLDRIDAWAGERCEASGCRPDLCGPVEYHDTEGVPLCAECWQECLDEAADEAPAPGEVKP